MQKGRSTNVAQHSGFDPATEGLSKQPSLLDKYRLVERMTSGDQAEIYKAKIVGVEGFERTVALKRILPSFAEDPNVVRTFIEEAKLGVQLLHENIAQILDLGRLDDGYFVALEFVHGRDLRFILDFLRTRGQFMPAPLVCHIIIQLCAGLDYVHNLRDETGRALKLVLSWLRPQDVMVGYEGEVKLFDVAVANINDKAPTTHPGLFKETIGYLSPEQVHGLPKDRRSDLFTLGILLYEMLTGARLFEDDNDFATLERIRDSRITSPTSRNSDIPARLENIVLKALAKDVVDRYQTAVDLRADLESFLQSEGQLPSRNDLATWMKGTFADHVEIVAEDNPSAPSTSLATQEDERFKLGQRGMLVRSAEDLSLPVPRASLFSSFDTISPPQSLHAPANAYALTSVVPPQITETPFPGMPICPPSQPRFLLARRLEQTAREFRGQWFKYASLFVLFLLVGGVGGYLLVPRSGRLQISVNPVDAHVAIDGVPVTIGPPFRLHKHAGVYRLTVSRPGYATLDQRISISARQRGHLGIVLKPSKDTGFELSGAPSNAVVLMDGRPLAIDRNGTQDSGNLRASRIAPGAHVLEIKGDPRYQPWAMNFLQDPGRTVHLHAALVPVPSVEDSSSAKTARRRIRRRPKAANVVKTSSGEQAKPSASAGEDIFESYGQSKEASAGNCVATISSRPWAEVSIDGKPTGKITPLVNYALPCGKHRLSFKNEDLMIERNESIVLKPDQPFKKIFSLADTDPWTVSKQPI